MVPFRTNCRYIDQVSASTGTLKHTRSKTGGQALIEFAIILPLLLFILMGVIDLGRAFYALVTITNAARVGARYAVLSEMLDRRSLDNPTDPTDDSIRDRIRDAAISETDGSGITIQRSDIVVECIPSNCGPLSTIRVTTNYHFDLIMQFFFPSGIYMSRYIEMLIP